MDDRIQLLIAHQLAYSYLSRVFYEPPSRELIDTLASDDLFDAFPLETSQQEAETGLALLRGFCAGWTGDGIEALQQDYRSLFVGPGHLLAAPWESVYLTADHVLFGPQTLQVRREFQRFGMTIPHLSIEPDDHLGLELRFIAHLCEVGLQALDSNQPEQGTPLLSEIRRFLSQHLLKWAPECLSLVIENARSDYYRGCAHLTLGCLAHTSEVIPLVTT